MTWRLESESEYFNGELCQGGRSSLPAWLLVLPAHPRPPASAPPGSSRPPLCRSLVHIKSMTWLSCSFYTSCPLTYGMLSLSVTKPPKPSSAWALENMSQHWRGTYETLGGSNFVNAWQDASTLGDSYHSPTTPLNILFSRTYFTSKCTIMWVQLLSTKELTCD